MIDNNNNSNNDNDNDNNDNDNDNDNNNKPTHCSHNTPCVVESFDTELDWLVKTFSVKKGKRYN